jgi:phenylacetate-CoA ligase
MNKGVKQVHNLRTTRSVRSNNAFRFPTLSDLHKHTSKSWSQEQVHHDLGVFLKASKSSKAYQKFLKAHGINSKLIRHEANFASLPPVSKSNYLRAFNWSELLSDSTPTGKHLVLASTSGSTGKSFYFPRTTHIDEQSTLFHRLFLENTGLDPKRSTLVISGFGLGPWIGGIITYEAFSRVSETTFPLTILTAGTNKKAIFDTLEEIGSNFEQVILCGYPPFVKDVLDEGKSYGVVWNKYDMRILCAAEAFSEAFRDYICKISGITDPLRGVANIYGTSDLGTMAIETPLSILVRRLALVNSSLYKALFPEVNRLPTLAQFIPSCVSFEEMDGKLFCTSDNALPLVRYDIGDKGGVFSYDKLLEICFEHGVNLDKEIRMNAIEKTVTKIPFVYVYERADLSTKLYGAIIYPEHVKSGLQHDSLQKHLTGKFTMLTKHDQNQNEFLEIHLELKPGASEDKAVHEEALAKIIASLLERSDEYRYLSGTISERIRPRLTFWPHAHPEHFQMGVKQRWVKK